MSTSLHTRLEGVGSPPPGSYDVGETKSFVVVLIVGEVVPETYLFGKRWTGLTS